MNKFNHWLAGAVLGVAMQSSGAYSETPIEAFMARVQAQQFNTQVMTLPTSAPSTVQMYMGQPATAINLDLLGLFDLPDFKIEFPGLDNLYAIKEKVQNNRFNGRNWTGDVFFLDPYGFETGVQGRAYFVEKNGDVTGVIHTADKIIQIFPDGAGGQVMTSSNPEDFAPEGEPVQDENGAQNQGATAADPIIGGRIDGESPATMANPYTIDVMFVVTLATAAAVSDVQPLIELSLLTGNDVLENSLIPARLRWVGTHYTPDYQETDLMAPTLYDMRDPNDGDMDEIHTVRATLGADMVMLVSHATNYCGIAYLDSDTTYAFSVVFHGCMSAYTPIHELGHNFGAHHDTNNASNYYYSFGYGLQIDSVEPYWRTVMSYPCDGLYCARVPYFSTPMLTYNDLPLGDAEASDNARVLRVRVAEVAGFNAPEVAYCSEFTSSNSNHVTAGRAYTESSGGIFPTTTYYAVGSADALGSYSFTSNTLSEEPAGYFTKASCSSTGETAFPPEMQNLQSTIIFGGVRIDGEVFDANSDDIVSIEAKLSTEPSWTAGTITNSNFSVELSIVVVGDIDVDIRATDATGASFSITQGFTLETGEPPTITQSYADFADQTVFINGQYSDPDNTVTELRYQIDGAGDPSQGTWTSFPIDNAYWTIEIPNVAVGAHTIHFFGVDESYQNSNVLSVDLTIPAAQAPLCVFAGTAPRYSGVAGEFDIHGFVEDINQGDIEVEYRLESGAWLNLNTYTRSNYREIWSFSLPQTYANGSTVNIETRATDSTGLQTSCGSMAYTVAYPSGDEAPSCNFTEVTKHQGYIRYYLMTSDANGNQAQIYAKESSQANWSQAWPAILTVGGLDLPGYGEFTIQGRVVDDTGLEGLCSTTITLANEGYAPIIDGAYGYFDGDLNTATASINAIDWDWNLDVTSVQVREVGSGTWLAATRNDDRNWNYDIGLLANATYFYETRATDVAGNVSDIFSFQFTVDRPVAPVLSNLNYVLNGRSAIVSGDTVDDNGNLDQIFFKLNNDAAFTMTASASWGRWVNNLVDGTNTIEVWATDTDGLESAHQTLTIDFDPGVAPVIVTTNLTVNSSDFSVLIGANATDADDDLRRLVIVIDGTETRYYTDFNNGFWGITVSNLAEGTHQIIVNAEDVVGNLSADTVLNFNIVPVQTCFTASNADHVTASRANTQLIGETCIGTFCFGGTDTYFANGSNDNMGTSASAITGLNETSTSFFEIGTCSTVDITAPIITLNGSSPMSIAIGSTFTDPGATASDNVDGNISANIIVSGSVNTAVAGSYQLTYNVSDAAGNAAIQATRTVNVEVDSVVPVITLIGNATMAVNVGGNFVDPGATASDNVDGDISANITVNGSVNTAVAGSYQLTYDVSDAAGNAANQVTRTVNVTSDAVAPIITLIGSATMSVNVGGSFVDPGASASDNVDGDITSSIVVSGSVNTAAIGSYVLNYNVSDTAGNAATQVSRTVNVVAASSCFTSTLADHTTAGRAYTQYSLYYATGTATYLGSTYTDANTIASLEETTPGNWDSVGTCN